MTITDQRARWVQTDTRTIDDWASQEVELPGVYAVPGRLDFDRTPFVKPVFDALRDRRIRTVVVRGAIQSLKTLVGELWLLWSVDQSPGPSQWLQPTDEEAKEHCEERFNSLMAGCPRVAGYYTGNRHEKKTAAVLFRHMFLRMEGAENLRNLQRKSIKNQMCSEVWQWPVGRLSEATARLTQFVHNSKQYIESQPGEVGDDMDTAYLSGHQAEWNVACLGCGHYQPLAFTAHREDGTRAGMRWDENEITRSKAGEWNWSELEKTVRWECIKCGHAHRDDPRERHALNHSGNFVPANPTASARSFTWNQFAVENLSWFDSRSGGVKKWLEARRAAELGNELPEKEFIQKVLAQPYDPAKFGALRRLPTVEVAGEKKWDRQDYIFCLVDVQTDGFWVLIQAWSKTGDSMVLWADRVVTWGDVRAKQQEWSVLDRHTFVDCAHDQTDVFAECCRFGWTALRGEDRDAFVYVPRKGPRAGEKILLPYSWPPRKGDPCLGRRSDDPLMESIRTFRVRYCPVMHWSTTTIKDIAGRRRDQMSKGTHSLVAPGVSQHFHGQMFAERKQPVPSRHGQTVLRWVRIGKRPNHLWDCFCMGAAAACLCQIIGESPPTE